MIRTDVVIATVIGALLTAGSARAKVNVEQIVAQNVQSIMPEKGGGGGVAVAVRIDGKTGFFNYGLADAGKNRRITTDSIFNLASVGKPFATTLLANRRKEFGRISRSERSACIRCDTGRENDRGNSPEKLRPEGLS